VDNIELDETFVPRDLPLTPALSPEYRGEGVGTEILPSQVRHLPAGMRITQLPQLPPRFQRVRARGWKMPIGGRCCSRPGRWGNPLQGEWAARYFASWAQVRFGPSTWKLSDLLEHAIMLRRDLHLHQPNRWKLITTAETFFHGITELAGRPLGCYCAPNEPCHVDTLLVLANELAIRRAGHDPAELLRWQIGNVVGGNRR